LPEVAATGRPHRTPRSWRASGPLSYQAPRPPRLARGQLRCLVLAHLRAFPDLDFTPLDLERVLGHSHGAVRTVCQQLVGEGLARLTSASPHRYQAAPTPQP
jgi:hypothetical protein